MKKFISNTEVVEMACSSLVDFMCIGYGKDVGCLLSLSADLRWVITEPVVGLNKDECQRLLNSDEDEIMNDGQSCKNVLCNLGVYMPFDFEEGFPWASEVDAARKEMEKRLSDKERKYQFEKRSFESCRSDYDAVMGTLSDTAKGKLCMIQSAPLIKGRPGADLAIEQFDAIWDSLPEVGSELILWRAGEVKPVNRPYISTTYSKEVAMKFADGNDENVHKILVRSEAKIFPMFLLERTDGEREVVLKTECLHKALSFPCCDSEYIYY